MKKRTKAAKAAPKKSGRIRSGISKIGKRIRNTVIAVLIIAAVISVLYFGFLQFQLPMDTYGVIFTKYTGSGWNPEVIEPGTLRIEWEGLIPMNLSIEKFHLEPVQSRVTLNGELPSSEIYGMYLEGSPDFTYSYSFDLTYTVKPSSLASLAADEFLREENLESWYEDLETGLVSDAAGFIQRMADDSDYMNRISYNYRLMEDDLIEELAESRPCIDFVSCMPVEIRFPDLRLYEEGRRQYFENEKHHSDFEQSALDETTERLVEEAAKLELLEKYGALFAKYPQLIDYYSIFRDDGAGMIPSMTLPELEELPETSAGDQQLLRGSN